MSSFDPCQGWGYHVPDGWFARPVAAMLDPLTDLLRERIGSVGGLDPVEADLLVRGATRYLRAGTELRLNRVLLLELHAASMAGRLAADDEQGRWRAFLDLAATPDFRTGLDERYPTLRRRAETAGRYLVEAVTTLAERIAADRTALAELVGGPVGRLRGLALGAGDPHRGGHTVSRLEFTGGTVMYKPRPLGIDAALDTVLAALLPGERRIRTARAVVRDGYGWTEFVRHRYCADDGETAGFYRNLGHWLAIARLVGGTDLHGGNLVADGPVPVVVDAETMFTPPGPAPGGARAVDAAGRLLRGSVLRTGILPLRMEILEGVDPSAVGRLPGQQPALSVPAIAGGGTDGARIEQGRGGLAPARNHPNPEPAPDRFWPQIVAGFADLSARLRELDGRGELPGLLAPFAGTEVRHVIRSTRVYGDVRQMLWHPAALHDEAKAIEQARAAFHRHARANPGTPDDPAAVDAEIAELLVGDTPVFTLPVDDERLAAALADWRAADLEREADFVRWSLAGVFRADPPGTAAVGARPGAPATGVGGRGREKRRRELAAAGARALRDAAIRGEDGSVTWIGPVRGAAGWAVRALNSDLYSGQAGVALCLAAYGREASAGRADPVAGLDDMLPGALAALRAAQDADDRGPGLSALTAPGALTGLAAQVRTWLALSRLLPDPSLLDRAATRATLLRSRLDPADTTERSGARAGAIMSLLDLAEVAGDAGWLETAARAADGLTPPDGQPPGEYGFAYGAAGTGWALRRIADSRAGTKRDRERWRALAERTFPFDRPGDGPGWCRGAAGIGLAACDLYGRTGDERYAAAARRAGKEAIETGFDGSRSLCHGAAGVWELCDTAARALPGPPVMDRADATARLLDLLEREPPDGPWAVETTAPGLMNGIAGTVLTLLRAHPDHEVPTALLYG